MVSLLFVLHVGVFDLVTHVQSRATQPGTMQFSGTPEKTRRNEPCSYSSMARSP